jgi:hypothetical protein
MTGTRIQFQMGWARHGTGGMPRPRTRLALPSRTRIACYRWGNEGHCFTAIAEISIFAPPIKPAT